MLCSVLLGLCSDKVKMTEVSCKAPVSALQEYLMKKRLPLPSYEFSNVSDKGSPTFQCIVTALSEMAIGLGRSKSAAKHEAAENILRKFQASDRGVHYAPQANMPEFDAVSPLRQMCVERNYPYPQFEITQGGDQVAPKFTCKCSVATLSCSATSSSKKWARQLAAQAVMELVDGVSKQCGFICSSIE